MGRRGVTVAGPVFEESAKTILAILAGAPVPWVHVVFGLIEAAYDVVSGSRMAILAVLLSVLAHTAFGLITLVVARAAASWPLAILIAVFVHALWNRILLTLLS